MSELFDPVDGRIVHTGTLEDCERAARNWNRRGKFWYEIRPKS